MHYFYFFIVDGNCTLTKLSHWLNALPPIISIPSFKITVSNVLLLLNAFSAISFTLPGIIIVFKPSTPENAPYPIF